MAVVEGLRAAGATVTSLAAVGRGCPDLVVGALGINYLIELKNPLVKPSARRLSPDEADWHSCWVGQVAIIETLEEALALVGLPKKKATPTPRTKVCEGR